MTYPTKADLCTDTALFLHKSGIGKFDPNGFTGNIFVEEYPANPSIKTVLYQQGGLQRELLYRGDIRYPILHVEVYNDSRLGVKQALVALASALEQKEFATTSSRYFYRLQSEPSAWKVSDMEYKGAVNFLVTQSVRLQFN